MDAASTQPRSHIPQNHIHSAKLTHSTNTQLFLGHLLGLGNIRRLTILGEALGKQAQGSLGWEFLGPVKEEK